MQRLDLVKDSLWREEGGENGLVFWLNGIFQFGDIMFLPGLIKREDKFKSKIMNWKKLIGKQKIKSLYSSCNKPDLNYH